MKISNLTAQEFRLGFVGAHGAILEASGSLVVDDKFASHPSLRRMVKDSLVSLSSFGVADDGLSDLPDEDFAGEAAFDRDFAAAVSPAEFNAIVKGLYVIPASWTSTGAPAASATPASITGTKVGPFDLSAKNVVGNVEFQEKTILKVKFDSLDSQIATVSLPSGIVPIASIVSALNGDAMFSKWGLASDDAGKLKIASKAVGVNSNVEILDHVKSAVKRLGLEQPTIVAGAGAVAQIVIATHSPVGEGLQGVVHAIKLFTTDIGGGSVVSTEFVIQRIQEGKISSGLHTAEVSIESGDDGLIKFEVAAPGAITEVEDWVGIVLPADHYFAQIPTSRLQVV